MESTTQLCHNQKVRLKGTNYVGKVAGLATIAKDNGDGKQQYITKVVVDLGNYGFYDSTHTVYTQFTLCHSDNLVVSE